MKLNAGSCGSRHQHSRGFRNVVTELERRGCTIPQQAFAKKHSNVINGQFAKPGQSDWAVLCSIKAFRRFLSSGGSERNPAAIAPMEDRIFLQGITATEIGYSRDIAAVGNYFIMKHYDAYGGTRPPLIDHQGIDDAFLEKASLTWYFFHGDWLKLTGAD